MAGLTGPFTRMRSEGRSRLPSPPEQGPHGQMRKRQAFDTINAKHLPFLPSSIPSRPSARNTYPCVRKSGTACNFEAWANSSFSWQSCDHHQERHFFHHLQLWARTASFRSSGPHGPYVSPSRSRHAVLYLFNGALAPAGDG